MEITLLALLILLNGLFAMSEIALVASRKGRLQTGADAGDHGSAVALELAEDPTRFMSTIQIGITSIGILNGIVGEGVLAEPLAAWLHLEGSDFTKANRTQDVVTWGGFATVRVSGRSRPLAPFGLLNLQIYPADATAYVQDLEPQWPIPRWSFLASLGARFSH